MSIVVSKSTILGYLGDAPNEVFNQISNILESHFHKTEGKIVKNITEANDKVTITFSDDTTKTFYTNTFIDDFIAAQNANPVDGWIFVKTKAQMEGLTGDSTKGYYVLKDDVDDANNGSYGFDANGFYQGEKIVKSVINKTSNNAINSEAVINYAVPKSDLSTVLNITEFTQDVTLRASDKTGNFVSTVNKLSSFIPVSGTILITTKLRKSTGGADYSDVINLYESASGNATSVTVANANDFEGAANGFVDVINFKVEVPSNFLFIRIPGEKSVEHPFKIEFPKKIDKFIDEKATEKVASYAVLKEELVDTININEIGFTNERTLRTNNTDGNFEFINGKLSDFIKVNNKVVINTKLWKSTGGADYSDVVIGYPERSGNSTATILANGNDFEGTAGNFVDVTDFEITIPASVNFIRVPGKKDESHSFNVKIQNKIQTVVNDTVFGSYTEPVPFRTLTYNILKAGDISLAVDGINGLNAILKHIKRVDADIATITEVGSAVVMKHQLGKLGYTNFHGGSNASALFFASKHPIYYSETLSNFGMVISPIYNEILINNKLIGVMSVHLNSSCTALCHDSDFLNVAPFEPAAQKRCIEMYKIIDFLNKRKSANPNLKGFMIQGDYNAIHNEANVLEYSTPLTDEYAELPMGLTYPLSNSQFPFKQFEQFNGTINLEISTAVDGSTYTWWGEPESPNPTPNNFPHPLDYVAYTDAITLIGSEILNSEADAVNPTGGLVKFEDALLPDDGKKSDHLLVFGDFEIN